MEKRDVQRCQKMGPPHAVTQCSVSCRPGSRAPRRLRAATTAAATAAGTDAPAAAASGSGRPRLTGLQRNALITTQLSRLFYYEKGTSETERPFHGKGAH